MMSTQDAYLFLHRFIHTVVQHNTILALNANETQTIRLTVAL